MNLHIEQKETCGLKICQSCRYEMKDRDRFCRRCGMKWAMSESASRAKVINLQDAIDATTRSSVTRPNASATTNTGGFSYSTTSLSQPVMYCSLSGSLVNAFAVGMAADPSIQINGNIYRRLTALFLSIPIWLMIILLSPLDAYLASKAFLK